MHPGGPRPASQALTLVPRCRHDSPAITPGSPRPRPQACAPQDHLQRAHYSYGGVDRLRFTVSGWPSMSRPARQGQPCRPATCESSAQNAWPACTSGQRPAIEDCSSRRLAIISTAARTVAWTPH
jgi:hypothetical protein